MLQFNDLARAFIATQPNDCPLSSTYSADINADSRATDNRTRGCVTDWRDNEFTIIRTNAFSKR